MKVTFVLFYQLLTFSRGNDCPTQGHYNITQFGDNCQYRCRCINEEQCERNTGTCQNGCAPGWMGPGCQYRNIASLASSAIQNTDPGTAASIAIDSDAKTCSNSLTTERHETWWRLDFPKPYYIVGLVLKIKTESNIAFRVEGSIDGFSTTAQCYRYSDTMLRKETEIMCLEPMYVQHIRIVSHATAEALQLCEVEIYGGRYVSYKGPTAMSSTFWASSSAAVDGRPMLSGDNQETDAERTCAVTNRLTNQSWKLWFTKDMLIHEIYVYGRRLPISPQIYGQSAGFVIHALPLNGTYSQIYSDDPSGSSWEDYQPRIVDMASPRKSSGVYIHRASIDHLALCEVEVFAECEDRQCGWDCSQICHCTTVATGTYRKDGRCPHGCIHRWTGQNGRCNSTCPNNTWGPNCTWTCNCSPGYQCNIDNGTCPGECDVGWKGPACNTSCENNMYGQNCGKPCGHCLDNEQCNAITGHCPGECGPGWEGGSLCQKECDDHWYGHGCNTTCNVCYESAPCNKVNGHCLNCNAGYIGDDCQIVCGANTYGLDCKETCGHCKNDVPCDPITGHCSVGCESGWTGRLCKETCADFFYGSNCNHSCGTCTGGLTCHYSTGVCESGCAVGKMPPLCQQDCPHYIYGQNCLGRCGVCKDNQPCHISTGECTDGCEPGYNGELCRNIDNSYESSVIAGLATVIGCLVVAIVVMVVCYKRRLSISTTGRRTESVVSEMYANKGYELPIQSGGSSDTNIN